MGKRSECSSQRKENTISTKVFVGNLSFSTSRDELQQLFSQAGRVVEVFLPTDRATGQPRGFAFVRYESDAEAAEAISRFNDFELGGRRLRVDAAVERAPRAPRFGGPPPEYSGEHRGGFGAGFGGGFGGGGHRPQRPGGGSGGGGGKPKGSRRGLRGRKRSL